MSKSVNPFLLAGLMLCALGGFGWMLFVVRKIADGHGHDIYFTWWGVQFSYIGALVLIASAFLVGLAAWLLRWWGTRQERKDTDTPPSA